jgi:hypothetical protein
LKRRTIASILLIGTVLDPDEEDEMSEVDRAEEGVPVSGARALESIPRQV